MVNKDHNKIRFVKPRLLSLYQTRFWKSDSLGKLLFRKNLFAEFNT
ncbi:hypothetical protein LEP1GSC192_0783 [Leptospira sp. B5-022]|nr:hypothetical protein LEP1GSC192_0783 [Leptospira sp. B5-022]